MKNMTLKKQFEKNGFAIIKKVFSAEEIKELRHNAIQQLQSDTAHDLITTNQKSKAKHGVGDILAKEYLSNVVIDPRIVRIAKEALGEDIIYFGDGSYQVGVGLRGYHRDNVDRQYNEGSDWDGEYDIIRFGIYLQDHKKYSGGLKVRVGTHINASGKSTLLDIEEGDVVFWNLKLLHSGNAIRLKFFPKIPIDYFEKYIPNILKKDEQKERIAMFFTYGLEGKHFERYKNSYILKTPKIIEGLLKNTYSDDVIEKTKKLGVKIIKVIDSK